MRILGVNVGKVTAVIPEGNSVRVEMEYDAQYEVPAEAKAAIVTPTLVADRFVQLTPAFEKGDKVMASGADIPLPDTGVPVELDRIYASLEDLTVALGPNGVNKDGTLNHTLAAARNAFEGNGALGNEMIRNLSEAAVTFGEGSGDLFDTVSSLARFTEVLATNDAVVRAFMKDLAEVSAALADEREELSAALASVADAVGTVETFVRDNRKALVTDLEKLTRTLKTINSEKESIDTALTVAPVAMGNLILAFDSQSSSVGSRIGVQQNVADLDGFLCAVVQQSGTPAVSKDLACTLFEQIVESGVPEQGVGPPGGPAGQGRRRPAAGRAGLRAPLAVQDTLRARHRRHPRRPLRRCVMSGLRRLRAAAVALVTGTLLLSGCEFDGAYDLPLPGSPVDEGNSYEVTAEFADILNVVPRSPVMVDDVVVGEVTDVERVGWHALVTLRVRDDVELPDNAIADIRQVSLLGEKYVALEAPESGTSDRRLGEGDRIPLSATGRNPEVEEVLGALSFLLSGGGVAQLGHHRRGAQPRDERA